MRTPPRNPLSFLLWRRGSCRTSASVRTPILKLLDSLLPQIYRPTIYDVTSIQIFLRTLCLSILTIPGIFNGLDKRMIEDIV